MRPDLKTWTCGHCKRTILVPPEGSDGHLDTLARIREHRFGHLTEALMHGSDEDLLGMCEDEPSEGTSLSMDNLTTAQRRLRDAAMGRPAYRESDPQAEPVSHGDVDSCIEDVMALLRADLPHARRLWYPVNEDGSFNR